MLPTRYRLRSTADVQRVRKYGTRRQHPLLILFIDNVPETATQPTRFAIVVGRRVGTAVVRNRVKRKLREIIRHQLSYVRDGHDIVIIARSSAVGASYSELEKAVVQLLTRSAVWNNRDQNSTESQHSLK